jgi:hypothetical protein
VFSTTYQSDSRLNNLINNLIQKLQEIGAFFIDLLYKIVYSQTV